MTCEFCGGLVGLPDGDDCACQCVWCAVCADHPVEIAGENRCALCVDDLDVTDPELLEDWADAAVAAPVDVPTGDRL